MGAFTDIGLENPPDEVKRELATIIYKQLFVTSYTPQQFTDDVLKCIGVENTPETKKVLIHGITLGKTMLSTQEMLDNALDSVKKQMER